MSRYTPWGMASTVDTLFKGVSIATTVEVDCLMVSCVVARKHLSIDTKKKAVVHGTYYVFSLDDALDYVLVDSDFILKLVADYLSDDPYKLFQFAVNRLSRVDPKFLIELEIEPDSKEYALWKAEKKRALLESFSSPDLIVSCEEKGDRFGVRTADGLTHAVCKKSYDNFCELIGDVSSILVTLSDIRNMEKYENA